MTALEDTCDAARTGNSSSPLPRCLVQLQPSPSVSEQACCSFEKARQRAAWCYEIFEEHDAIQSTSRRSEQLTDEVGEATEQHGAARRILGCPAVI